MLDANRLFIITTRNRHRARAYYSAQKQICMAQKCVTIKLCGNLSWYIVFQTIMLNNGLKTFKSQLTRKTFSGKLLTSVRGAFWTVLTCRFIKLGSFAHKANTVLFI